MILALLGMLGAKKNIEWAVFPGIGGIIGLWFCNAFLADGSLTQLSGGVSNVIASASTNASSIWQAIQLVPISFTLASFLIAIIVVGRSL